MSIRVARSSRHRSANTVLLELVEVQVAEGHINLRPIQFDFLRCSLPCVTRGKRLSHLHHVLHMVNV